MCFGKPVLASVIDFILHIDQHLLSLSAQYGVWIYAILFLIVFCETGLIVTPFLPGDSLLFAAVFFVKTAGFAEVFAPEDFRIGVGEQPAAEIFADGKIERVAEYGGKA